jgi:hypothetical protein
MPASPAASSLASHRPAVTAVGNAMERGSSPVSILGRPVSAQGNSDIFLFPRDLFKLNQINSNIVKFE